MRGLKLCLEVLIPAPVFRHQDSTSSHRGRLYGGWACRLVPHSSVGPCLGSEEGPLLPEVPRSPRGQRLAVVVIQASRRRKSSVGLRGPPCDREQRTTWVSAMGVLRASGLALEPDSLLHLVS